MKKKIIPVLFSFFLLAGCGEPKVCETHDFGDWTVTKEAKCNENGKQERTCKVCGLKNEKEITALEHDYKDATDQTGAVAATCKDKGTVITECKNCGAKSTREVEKTTEHNFVDAEDQTGAVNPTCKDAGTVITQCTICGEKSTRVAEKLTEHQWGEWQEVTAATHATAGSKKRTCSVCAKEETGTIDKDPTHTFGETPTHVDGDHDLIGYDIYTCATDNVREIVWNANDVTVETKEDKYNNEDNYVADGDGVKFGGRSKGNAFTKPVSTPTQVFDESVPGSFLEYKINVKSAMVGAQLIADLKSANYLSSTGGLFMTDSSQDWTPGLIKDETAESGYSIPDFRIQVVVNDKVVSLDASKNLVGQSNYGRDWYELPCTVDLKAGVNTIKLVQTGGWESTFYNFGVISASGVENVVPDASEGYTVAITGDANVKSVTVFEDKKCTVEDTATTHYSRNEYGRKTVDGEGQISFAVEVEEGYQIKEIKQVNPAKQAYKNIKNPADTAADTGRDNVYRITKIEGDVEFEIITESTEVVYDGNKITFVLGDHITGIEIYESKTYAAETKVEGLVAFVLNESTLKPTFDEGQVYLKIFIEEGYELDVASCTYTGETKPFKNIKGPKDTDAENGYRLTQCKVTSTITLVTKAIAA